MVPTGRTSQDILNDPDSRIISSGFDDLRDQRRLYQDKHDATSLANRKGSLLDRNAEFGWGISLAQFGGPGRLARARQMVAQAGLKKVLYVERDGMVDILMGHYAKRNDSAAIDDLVRWQHFELDQKLPFAEAAISARPAAKDPTENPLDADAYTGYATLLVAVYNADFGPKWKEEAERVAKLLRQAGPDGQGSVEAYFRHGEKESAVLAGLFTKHDDWRKMRNEGERFFVDAPGPAVEAAQSRFPFILRNNKKVPKGGDGTAIAGGFEAPQLVELK